MKYPLLFFAISTTQQRTRGLLFNSVTLLFVLVQFADMFFKVKIPAESLAAFLACKWLLVIMRVHVESEIVHLMESLAADVALEGLLPSVSESVIFIIALLMKTLAANIAHKRLVTSVDADVSV